MADQPVPPDWGYPAGAILHDDGSVTMPDGTPVTTSPNQSTVAQGLEPVATQNPTPTTPPPTAPAPTGGLGSGIYTAPAPPPGSYDPGPAPVFTPVAYTPPPAFQAPTAAEAANDPGYQFSLSQGEQALAQSAAAKGTLNTGGTLEDANNYAQAAAATQYGNVYTRNLGTYNENYQTQFSDPYRFAEQAALDQFTPQMTAWGTRAQLGAQQAGQNQTQAYNTWLAQYQQLQDSIQNQMRLAGV